jgi:hypothetical protein
MVRGTVVYERSAAEPFADHRGRNVRRPRPDAGEPAPVGRETGAADEGGAGTETGTGGSTGAGEDGGGPAGAGEGDRESGR